MKLLVLRCLPLESRHYDAFNEVPRQRQENDDNGQRGHCGYSHDVGPVRSLEWLLKDCHVHGQSKKLTFGYHNQSPQEIIPTAEKRQYGRGGDGGSLCLALFLDPPSRRSF